LKPFLKDFLIVALAGVLATVLIYLTVLLTGYKATTVHPLFLPLLFLPVSAISLMLVHVGEKSDAATQTTLALAAVGVKFLLPAILALIWFVALKNNTYTDVFLFFIVYLALGITTVLLILKKLKNNP